MPIQGDLMYNNPASMYAGAPVDEVKALNADASQQYNQGKSDYNALQLMADTMPVEERNIGKKKQYIEALHNRLKSIVKGGNYEDASNIVAKEVNDFKRNQELQDILKSKQMRDNYLQDQRKRLDEGKINRSEFEYAMDKTKANNQEPTKYNPDTMTSDNMFNGHNLVDNKSKEIYDTTYKRITDWKESGTPMTVNGKLVTYDKVKGFTYDAETGKRVDENEVYSALKKEVEGTYGDFLKQERDVQNHKRFYNRETGQYNQLSRQDVPLVDEDIKTLLSGHSEKTLESLKKKADKGEVGAKLAYNEALKQYQDVNPNNPEHIAHAYDAYQRKAQLDSYVSPAASKASYFAIDHHLFEDKEAEMALQHKYKMAEINYEKSYTKALPSNYSQVSKVTPQDYQDNVDQDKNMKMELAKAAQKLAESSKPGVPDVYKQNAKRDFDRLKYLNEASDNRQLEYVKKLGEKDPNVVKSYIQYNIPNIVNEIRSNPLKYSAALRGNIELVEKDISDRYFGGKDLNKLDRNEQGTAQALLRKALTDRLTPMLNKEHNGDDLLKNIIVSTNANSNTLPANIVDAIDVARRNSDVGINNQTEVFGIDPNTDKSWEKAIYDRTSNLVKSTATNWLVGDKSLDEIVSNPKILDLIDNEGHKAKIDLEKSIVSPEIGHSSGLNTVRILLKDSEGKPIFRDGDKKSEAALSLTPGNQDGISNLYRELGTTLMASVDGNAQKQGAKILGYTKFAPTLNSVDFYNMNDGQEKNLILPSNGTDLHIKVIKGAKGAKNLEGFQVLVDHGGTFVPMELKDLSGNKTNVFGSKEQFETLLVTNGY